MRSLLLVPALLLFLSMPAAAGKYRELDAAGVKRLMDGGNVLVVNPMTPIEFDHEHLPGSVNIPIEALAEKLPRDKTLPLIFYCLGQKCVYSWRAADEAMALGYTNIHLFRGGVPEWKSAGFPLSSTAKLPEAELRTVSTVKLEQLLVNDDVILLDINSEEDARKFWIDTPKRVAISLDELKSRYGTLPKEKKIVVMCLRGQRAPTAVRFLLAKGYKDVQMLDGGLEKWVFEGRPVKKGS